MITAKQAKEFTKEMEKIYKDKIQWKILDAICARNYYLKIFEDEIDDAKILELRELGYVVDKTSCIDILSDDTVCQYLISWGLPGVD